MHRFVVVGGGAGGLELATRLGDRYARAKRGGKPRAQVTLVDRNPTHIW
jgi:NADH dehydrogenase